MNEDIAAGFTSAIEDGVITRIEEYADSRTSDPLRAYATARRESRS